MTESKLNPLSANPAKSLKTLKQFVCELPANCLSVFDRFVGLALKGLKCGRLISVKINDNFRKRRKIYTAVDLIMVMTEYRFKMWVTHKSNVFIVWHYLKGKEEVYLHAMPLKECRFDITQQYGETTHEK